MKERIAPETLKSLVCCSSFEVNCCSECPYIGLELVECIQKLAAGALAYIKYLEKKNE